VRMCVCMYVCVYTCVCVRMYLFVLRASAFSRAYTYVCMRVYIFTLHICGVLTSFGVCRPVSLSLCITRLSQLSQCAYQCVRVRVRV